MTDDSFASFFSQPLGVAFLAAVVAAITAVVTVKVMVAQGLITAAPYPGVNGSTPHDPAVVAAIAAAIAATFGASRIVHIAAVRQQHVIIAAIAAAIAAVFGNARIVHIGIVPSASARATQFGVPPGPCAS